MQHDAYLEWLREAERAKRDWEWDRIQWKMEHDAHLKWVKEVERTKRDWELEEEKQRQARLTWGPISRGHCIRYETRHYSAQLRNVPEGLDPVKGCRMLGLEINGKLVKPNECDYQDKRNVWGNWNINYEEATCRTWWKPPQDKGCTAEGSGYRKFEASLENVHRGDSWEKMCETTPVQFHEHSFDSPHVCYGTLFGVYGIWNIPDNECR
ncbi:hypothetical protein BDQ17DRAFT_1452858, partial [Cyathus striatus]